MHPRVEDFFLQLDAALREQAYHARDLILSAAPHMEEKFSYKVPFYYYLGPLCYFNPGKTGLYIGFVRGTSIHDEYGLLQGDHLKQIRHYALHKGIPLNEEALRSFLQQSIMMNEMRKSQRSR